MRSKVSGNKRDEVYTVIHNAETVNTMSIGQIAVFVLNGTNDGLDCQLPATLGATQAQAVPAGVVATQGFNVAGIPSGGYGEACVYGFCPNVQLTQQTRASSTAAWATQASVAQFQTLIPETLSNGMTTLAAQSFLTVSTGTAGVAVSQHLAFAVIAQTLASFASSASATSDTRTAITTMVKAFVRFL